MERGGGRMRDAVRGAGGGYCAHGYASMRSFQWFLVMCIMRPLCVNAFRIHTHVRAHRRAARTRFPTARTNHVPSHTYTPTHTHTNTHLNTHTNLHTSHPPPHASNTVNPPPPSPPPFRALHVTPPNRCVLFGALLPFPPRQPPARALRRTRFRATAAP